MTRNRSTQISAQTIRALRDLRGFRWTVAVGAWLLCMIAAALVVSHEAQHVAASAVLAFGATGFACLLITRSSRMRVVRYNDEKIFKYTAAAVRYEREAAEHLDQALHTMREARLMDAEHEHEAVEHLDLAERYIQEALQMDAEQARHPRPPSRPEAQDTTGPSSVEPERRREKAL